MPISLGIDAGTTGEASTYEISGRFPFAAVERFGKSKGKNFDLLPGKASEFWDKRMISASDFEGKVFLEMEAERLLFGKDPAGSKLKHSVRLDLKWSPTTPVVPSLGRWIKMALN